MSLIERIKEFLVVLWLYKRGGNTWRVSLRTAWGCGFCGLPF